MISRASVSAQAHRVMVGNKRLHRASRLAHKAHAHQVYKVFTTGEDLPYVEHPLRLVIRLDSWGVTDDEILVAALLHDVVEDSPEIVSGLHEGSEEEIREAAFARVKEMFGAEVDDLIHLLSNPIASPGSTREERVADYLKHVKMDILTSEKALLVKSSDLLDNAGSLPVSVEGLSNSQVKRRVSLAKKYVPLPALFLNKIKAEKSRYLSDEGQASLIASLEELERKLQDILSQ